MGQRADGTTARGPNPKYDYDLVWGLRTQGLGSTEIMRATGYPRNIIHYAVRRQAAERGVPALAFDAKPGRASSVDAARVWELYTGGMPAREVARTLGATEDAVRASVAATRTSLRAQGVEVPRVFRAPNAPPERPWHPEALELAGQGRTSAQIAQHLGLSRNAVWRFLKRRGLTKTTPGRPCLLDYADAARLRDSGWTLQQVADKYGVSNATVWKGVKAYRTAA